MDPPAPAAPPLARGPRPAPDGVRVPLRTVFGVVLLTASLLPLFAIMQLVVLFAAAWVELGAPPQPYRPDPKDISFAWHSDIVTTCFAAAVLSPIVVVGVLAIGRQIPSLRRPARDSGFRPTRWLLALHQAGILALYGVVVHDPFRALEWLMD